MANATAATTLLESAPSFGRGSWSGARRLRPGRRLPEELARSSPAWGYSVHPCLKRTGATTRTARDDGDL